MLCMLRKKNQHPSFVGKNKGKFILYFLWPRKLENSAVMNKWNLLLLPQM